MKKFYKNASSLFLAAATVLLSTTSYSQFGCATAVTLTDGFTQAGITTPGNGGPEDWNNNPTGTSINASYWDDDVYMFQYTAGATDEQISMEIFTRNSWNGVGIFDDCTGADFSNELAASSTTSADYTHNISATVTAGNTVYIAVGQYGTPDDLDFDVVSFSVSSCLVPNSLSASNITSTTLDFSWVEAGTATNWDIEWGTQGFTPTGTPTVDDHMSNTYNATGLTANTSYDFYVRADCGADNSNVSDWVGPFTVTTPCDAFTPYFIEEFATFTPDCWQQAGAGNPTDGASDLGASNWGATSYLNAAANGTGVKINLYTTNREDFILSPIFDLSGGATTPFELRLQAGATTYNGTGAATMGSDDTVQVLISEDGGTTWTAIYTWDATNTPGNTAGVYTTIDLTAYTNANTSFAIWAKDGPVDDSEDYDFHIGTFEIREIPSCLEPNTLSSANVTATSLDFSWVEAGTATNWDIEWGTQGFTPTGTPTVDDHMSNTYNATGLSGNTSYDFYVRADCGADNANVSTWVGPFTVTTPCDAFTPYFIEEFATFTPDCWQQAGSGNPTDGASDLGASNWGATSYLNAAANGTGVKINLYTTNREDFILSPTFDLSGGATTPFELRLEAGATTYNGTGAATMGSDDTVQVLISEDGGATWTAIYTWDATNSPSNAADVYTTIDLSAYTNANTSFAIWAKDGPVNDTEDYDFHIGTFEIREIPPCPDPTDFALVSSDPTSATLSWTGTAPEYQFSYGAPGFDPATGMTSTVFSNPGILTGLTANAEYEVYVRNVCGIGDSSGWAGPVSFDTYAVISNYPYNQDFEGDNDGWVANNLWEVGAPAGATINTALSGTNAWMTDLDANYPNNADAVVVSPEFDFTSVPYPSISMGIWYNSENSWDGTVLQSSIDGGTSWQNVGAFGDPNNWYNDNSINGGPGGQQEGWTQNSNQWVEASHGVYNLGGQSSVRFRFAFGSDGSVNGFDGFAFDDFTVESIDCPEPTNIVATVNNLDSLVMTWTEVGGATQWAYEYGAAGFTPGTGTTVIVDSPTDTLLNMDESVYEFYVRAICGAGDSSVWAGPIDVIRPIVNDTICGAIEIPTDLSVTTFTTIGAGNDDVAGTTYNSAVWFKVTVPASGNLAINTCGSDMTSALALFETTDCSDDNATSLLLTGSPFGNVFGCDESNAGVELCGLTPGNEIYFAVYRTSTFYDQDNFVVQAWDPTYETGTGSDITACYTDSVELAGQVTGQSTNPYAEFTWVYPTNPNAVENNETFVAGNATPAGETLLFIANGCAQDTLTIMVAVSDASNAGEDGTITACKGQQINLYEGLEGNVDLGGSWYNVSGDALPSGDIIAGAIPGQYNYEYIADNGVCQEDTAVVTVTVEDCIYVGVEELELTNLSIFPNPTSEVVYISNSGSNEVFNFEILDLNGKVISSQENAINGTETTEVSLAKVEKGIYMIRVFNTNAERTFRVVKQ